MHVCIMGGASLHGAEDRQKTFTSVVRASTKCDAVLKGAIPFYAFAHCAGPVVSSL